MPRYTPGTNPITCHGKRESVIFQNAGNGAVIRRRVAPTQKKKQRSTQSRSNLLTAASNWRNLSPSEQSEWQNLADTFPQTDSCGNNYFLSGQQLFIKGNKSLADVQDTISLIAPATISVASPTITSMNLNPGTNFIEFIINPANVPADNFFLYYATAPMSAGISSPPPGAFVFFADTVPTEETDININPTYEQTFGNPFLLPGNKIFFAVQAQQESSGIQGSRDIFAAIIP